MWFPRPAGESDVEVEGCAPPDRAALLRWLGDPRGEEWHDKVGVAGSVDGSAKTTTRLLHVDGWVLKTRVGEGAPLEVQRERLARLARLARAGIWHPDKRFFLLRDGGGWLLASACPRLVSVRALEGVEERLLAFVGALEWSLRVSRESGLGLDLNPSNFGLDPARPGERVHYLDDETYPPIGPREIGEAIAGRMPEEDPDPEMLTRVGQAIARAFARSLRTGEEWAALLRGLDDYPLVASGDARRQIVRAAIVAGIPRRIGRAAPRLTCVLADVHANRPALDAVLAAAREAGADSWLVLGDVVGYGPHPAECVARIADLEPAVRLRGNHDHAVGSGTLEDGMNRMAREVVQWTIGALSGADRAWLAGLDVEHVDEDWMAVHGAPRDPHRFYAYVYELTFRDNLEHLRAQRRRLCFYGHTHVPFVHRAAPDGAAEKLGRKDLALGARDTLLVNPGSVGQPRDGDHRASFLLWDRRDDRLEFRRAAYPLDVTIRDLARIGLPRDLAFRLETGR